ncbi:hypothetical protein [Kineosporia mesophila]|uniref:hypothetical protein n=1 Tax=Kineosporia mesophila TaxID=566012 RepID=UPI001E520B2D|nr:hypothetical protein [Kineosporia mesophila]MCD5348997.1 hypothetical protein [Kineosporia mesophila]
MSTCACGASLAHEVNWCLRCYQPRPVPTALEPLMPDVVPTSSRVAAEGLQRRRQGVGRWDATEVTFGVPGRILGTILVTLPLLFFLRNILPFGFVGVVTYLAVYPRFLRDLWRRSDRL